MLTHHSSFAGAHDFANYGPIYHILRDCTITPKASNPPSNDTHLRGIVRGRHVLNLRNVSLIQEIYKGHGYRIHSARDKRSGEVVSIKIYEGDRAKERCSASARFLVERKMMHSNIPHLIAVSALESEIPFLVLDGEYEHTVDYVLSRALQKDLKESLTLGLQTVISLSLGLNYLQDFEFPFASVGLDQFVVFSSRGKMIIAFDLEEPTQINQSDQESGLSNGMNDARAFFHELCHRVFDAACKAHYKSRQIQRVYFNEFDDLPEDRFEEVDDDLSSSIAPTSPSARQGGPPWQKLPRHQDGQRQELVWKSHSTDSVALSDISHQFTDLLNSHRSSTEPALNRRRGRHTSITSHRCPGYNRIEITLATDITRNAIVSHSSPTPGEICLVCKEIVKEDIFNCICGSNGDEFTPTVRCSACSEWHHRPCVRFFSANNHHKFVCERCNVQQAAQHFPQSPEPPQANAGPRMFNQVFQPSTDLEKHYGIPQILPTAPRTPPKQSSAITDFQTLSANYLNMLSTKPTDTSVDAPSASAISSTISSTKLEAPLTPYSEPQLQNIADILAASPEFRDLDDFDSYMGSPLSPYSDFLNTPLFTDDALLNSPNLYTISDLFRGLSGNAYPPVL
ncbi:hypothetical protein GALMADRAFT_1070341 [Galerina marginata CBS 339.88]|uniref:Zinc finger PHD-type domain-containing protein n=1 Tax=Galerina marginata (strain CBS 339.88) TaxID=685588 RepID=A0A067SLJ4_GALM3|nr:hypothetical protein GALMADRAFT_1070341 [Galerina marginata CBS 339.88]